MLVSARDVLPPEEPLAEVVVVVEPVVVLVLVLEPEPVVVLVLVLELVVEPVLVLVLVLEVVGGPSAEVLEVPAAPWEVPSPVSAAVLPTVEAAV